MEAEHGDALKHGGSLLSSRSLYTDSHDDAAVAGVSMGIQSFTHTVNQSLNQSLAREPQGQDDLPGATQAHSSGPALSTKSLINPSLKKARRISVQQEGKFDRLIDAMMVEAGGSASVSPNQTVAVDDMVVERSRQFLNHERRVSGLTPLQPRPPDRPQTQGRARQSSIVVSPFAQQDLTKWYPESAREGNSSLPIKALLTKR
jgi:hypothetical protein